jgi:hypothetical protein
MTSKFVPTDAEIQLATTMTVAGISQEQIAFCIRDGIDPKTLRKHFEKPMRVARAKAHSNMGKNIYQRGLDGDGPLSKFYAATQMGWKEKSEIEHSGDISWSIQNIYEK